MVTDAGGSRPLVKPEIRPRVCLPNPYISGSRSELCCSFKVPGVRIPEQAGCVHLWVSCGSAHAKVHPNRATGAVPQRI